MADLPYYHSYGLTAGLLMGLSQGAEMVILPHYPKEHANAMVEALAHHGVDYLIGLPTTFDRVIGRLGKEPALRIHLKGGLSSGAALEEGTREAFEALTGAWLRQGLGLTEASSVIHEPIGVPPVEGSIGLPMPDVEIMVVDPNIKDRLVPIHTGAAGELVGRGPQVFKGYWDNPQETHKVKTAEGWLRTGDLVRMDRSGRIFMLTRQKNMIKVSGNQVFPSEVEKVLAAHPKIAEVAVFGIPDDVTGEKVVAYIRPKEGRSLTDKEVEEFARKELSVFKVPTLIRTLAGPLPRLGTFDEINYLGNCLNTTWGIASTHRGTFPLGSAPQCSIKGELVGMTQPELALDGSSKNDLKMVLRYTTIVNFGSDQEFVADQRKFAAEARKLIGDCVKTIKKDFKLAAGRALKLKQVNDDGSAEVIYTGSPVLSFYSQRQRPDFHRAYYRHVAVFNVT